MKAIGIDLGTTNSVAAVYRADRREAEVLPASGAEPLTPSVVAFRAFRDRPNEGEMLVGRMALNYSPRSPEDTILSIKRLMGRDYDDPKIVQVRERFNYRVVRGPGNDPRAHVRLGGRDYSPVDISAMVLKRIKDGASTRLGEEVTHAVITVPAYFNEHQRAATREAGEKAGLVVKKIIDEPTAAAVAFGVRTGAGERHRILVFDLGGGTFDISILQMVKDQTGRDQFQVLHTEGDNWLGGDDFDREIVTRIVAWMRERYGVDPSDDKRFILLAKKSAEEARRALSESTEVEIVIPAAYTAPDGPKDVDLVLTRAELDEMIHGYVDRAVGLVEKALRQQSLAPDDVSDVLLVGGATLTPLVYRAVTSLFGESKIRRNINPMECVALGAGVLAGTLHGVECPKCLAVNDDAAAECASCGNSLASARAVGDTGFTEVTAMSLGIRAVKGNQRDAFVPIIPKNTPYPLQEPMKERFQPTNERRIVVPVYEGDEPVVSGNTEVGVIEYELPQEISVTTPVEVSINYDRHRQVTVTIAVPGTGLLMTKTLRHDLPRSAPSEAVDEGGGNERDWQDELGQITEFATDFLDRYERYMDPGQNAKIRRTLENAKRCQVYPDEVEGRRLIRTLQKEVFNAGLATQLFLADRATEGAPQELARRINETVLRVRESHERGDRALVADEVRVLKAYVAQAIQPRVDVKEIADQEDYGGLLRLLGG